MSPVNSFVSFMGKRLPFLLVLLLSAGSFFAQAQSQTSLFGAPDTVCVRQPVQLTDSVTGASSYFWSFCSGNIRATPQLLNLGNPFGFRQPSSIEVVKDGTRYYAFVTNQFSNTLTKLDFGTSLANAPLVTPLGIANNTVPASPGGIFLLKDSGNYFLFVSGGTNAANSSLARFDFGNTLANVPNSVNFGNVGNVLRAPKGLFIGAEGGNYYGYVLNSELSVSSVVGISFGSNLSNTPSFLDLGNIGALDQPHDLAPINDSGRWTFFITNPGSSTISRLTTASLAATPTGVNEGAAFGKLNAPTGISYVRDCDAKYLFVTNRGSNDLVRINLSTTNAWPVTVAGVANYPGVGGEFNAPLGLSSIIRDSSNLYAFAVNSTDSSLVRIRFNGCNGRGASAFFSTDSIPRAFSYDTAGIYTVYLSLDEGLPTMRTGCRQIFVQAIPGINLSNDTLICQGDSIRLVAQSIAAESQRWRPAYNISDSTANTIRAYPEYTVEYRILFNYTNGCRVDTGITVRVLNNKADAGPDRVIQDGATTLLGGPLTSNGLGTTYRWFPANYLDNPLKANPVANPLTSYTYYLTVTRITDELTCSATDSVVLLTQCGDFYLPNAFVPEGAVGGANRFGLLNRQIVKLNYFRIFDRWGGEVFSTTDVAKEWDGTRNGELVLPGVYIWEADGFCASGQRLKKSGNVTVLR